MKHEDTIKELEKEVRRMRRRMAKLDKNRPLTVGEHAFLRTEAERLIGAGNVNEVRKELIFGLSLSKGVREK